jgi:hypothetical protein
MIMDMLQPINDAGIARLWGLDYATLRLVTWRASSLNQSPVLETDEALVAKDHMV